VRLEQGQVAVVTGAASGIGLELTRTLLARGLSLVMVDVEGPALEGALSGLGAGADSVLATTADVTSSAALTAVAQQTLRRFGRVDVVCNNAGVVGPRLPAWEQSEDDYRWVLEVNLGGVINGLRAFVPHLVARNSGHVLNTASIAALTTIRGGGNGPYAASKHAVLGLSEVLREELALAAPGVGVSVLCPGPVATRIRESARNRPGGTAAAQTARPDFEHTVDVISAAAAAQIAVEGIESGRFLLLTDPGNAAEARSRMAALGEEIDSAPDAASGTVAER